MVSSFRKKTMGLSMWFASDVPSTIGGSLSLPKGKKNSERQKKTHTFRSIRKSFMTKIQVLKRHVH